MQDGGHECGLTGLELRLPLGVIVRRATELEHLVILMPETPSKTIVGWAVRSPSLRPGPVHRPLSRDHLGGAAKLRLIRRKDGA
jgi:hypothetical protein